MFTPTQEMTLALLLPETVNEVKKLFKSDSKIVVFEAFDTSFRLFKAEAGNINLEIMLQMPIEDAKIENITGFGKGVTQKMVTFFKPIGFYTQQNGLFSNGIEIKILKEFEEDLSFLRKQYNELSKLKIGTLSIIKNAIIAAFSMESYANAMKYKDISFISNGLSCDIYLTLEGFPQFFLDDKYGITGPIAAYPMREHDFVAPIIEYTKIFENLNRMSLLTLFKEDKNSNDSISDASTNEFTDKRNDISDTFINKLANDGNLVKLKLKSNEKTIYGYIIGVMSGEDLATYEFMELIDYNEKNPIDEEEHDIDYHYFKANELMFIDNIKNPSFKASIIKNFEALMNKLVHLFDGHLYYEISQHKTLTIKSSYIRQPSDILIILNSALENENDWIVFNAMHFDLIIFSGRELSIKLTNEEIYQIFIRRK